MKRPKYTGERLVPDSTLLNPMRVENLARFRFFANRAQGKHILDMGCGTGEGADYLAGRGDWQVVGIDISIEAIRFAHRENRESGASYLQMDVEKLAFSDASFDAIVSVEVIEHVPHPEDYLSEAFRMLKPGGLFLLTTPNRLRSSPKVGTLWPEHLREYDPNQLRQLLLGCFPSVDLWGECIPVYENHPIRKLVRRLAPYIKPILPHWLRVRALPMVQSAIKSDINEQHVSFSQENIEEMPTLVAVCQK